MPGLVPPLTREWLAELDRLASGSLTAQAELCSPEMNPHAAAYFATRFCRTLDEERGGAVELLPEWDYFLRFISFLDSLRTNPANGLVDKSRRLTCTWGACAYVMWRAQHTRGFLGFVSNGKGQDYVDDGGEHSTPRSLFGKMRFVWERLPDHVRKPMDFAFKRAVCSETDAYITGEAPTEQAGRAGGYSFGLVDEAAFLPFSEGFNRALDPACKTGRLYMSTPNGPSNVFARIIKTRPRGWRVLVVDWKDHPELAAGLEATPDGEVDRFGPHVSPKFREITASLRDDDIAQEYNHSLERSLKGLVYKEFNVRKHVPAEPVGYDSEHGLVVGVDYGATGFGAAVVGQKVGEWSLRCVADYELEGAGGAKEHARNLWDVICSIGFEGDPSEVLLVGGPDTDSSQTGSGQTVAGYYKAFGFTRVRQSRLRGPGSVDRGITVVCTALREDRIRISPACRHLVGRFGEYRWPVERGTGVVRATAPVHNDASHVMDAFRYLVTDSFPRESKGMMIDRGMGSVSSVAAAVVGDTYQGRDRSLFRPVVAVKREF